MTIPHPSPLIEEDLRENLRDNVVVAKLSGGVLESPLLEEAVKIVALLRQVRARVILVHGGGKQLTAATNEARFHPDTGLRITATGQIASVEREIGRIGRELTSALHAGGMSAVPLGHAVTRGQRLIGHAKTGTPTALDARPILAALEGGRIPIVPFGGVDEKKGETLNMNADAVAALVAGTTNAVKLLMLSEKGGIVVPGKNGHGRILPVADLDTLLELLSRKAADGGSLIKEGTRVKVKAAITALSYGVPQVHIVQASLEAVREELLTRIGSPGATLVQREQVLHAEHPADEEHVQQILKIRAEAGGKTPGGVPYLKELSDADASRLYRKSGVVLLQRRMVAGAAYFMPLPDAPATALIGGFVIGGRHQGAGYAGLLLQAVLDEIRDKGMTSAVSVTASPVMKVVFGKYGTDATERWQSLVSDRYGDERQLAKVFAFDFQNGAPSQTA